MIDIVFWWVGAVVCATGSVAMTLVILWWCFDKAMTTLGVTARFLNAWREVQIAKRKP